MYSRYDPVQNPYSGETVNASRANEEEKGPAEEAKRVDVAAKFKATVSDEQKILEKHILCSFSFDSVGYHPPTLFYAQGPCFAHVSYISHVLISLHYHAS